MSIIGCFVYFLVKEACGIGYEVLQYSLALKEYTQLDYTLA